MTLIYHFNTSSHRRLLLVVTNRLRSLTTQTTTFANADDGFSMTKDHRQQPSFAPVVRFPRMEDSRNLFLRARGYFSDCPITWKVWDVCEHFPLCSRRFLFCHARKILQLRSSSSPLRRLGPIENNDLSSYKNRVSSEPTDKKFNRIIVFRFSLSEEKKRNRSKPLLRSEFIC